MAKKVVATLKTGTGKDWAKVIRAVKSPKTGISDHSLITAKIVTMIATRAKIIEGDDAQFTLDSSNIELKPCRFKKNKLIATAIQIGIKKYLKHHIK